MMLKQLKSLALGTVVATAVPWELPATFSQLVVLEELELHCCVHSLGAGLGALCKLKRLSLSAHPRAKSRDALRALLVEDALPAQVQGVASRRVGACVMSVCVMSVLCISLLSQLSSCLQQKPYSCGVIVLE